MNDNDELKIIIVDGRGLIAYTIGHDWLGNKTLYELMTYVLPECRGDIRLIKRLLKEFERQGSILGAKYVSIGSSIGYNNDGYMKMLSRFGYNNCEARKEL